MTTTVENIRAICAGLADFLAEKNASYGDSAASPLRVFARGVDAETGILVRIDDKLSRLARGSEYQGDDTVKDLAGYLILLLAVRRGAQDGALAAHDAYFEEHGFYAIDDARGQP